MNVRPMTLAFVLALARNASAAPAVDYTREVKPILTARCTSCHGAIRQKAGLRLDTAEFVRRGGDSGPAVAPGKSSDSLLIDRVTGADGLDRMPPDSEGVALSDSRGCRAARVDRPGCQSPAGANSRRPAQTLGVSEPEAADDSTPRGCSLGSKSDRRLPCRRPSVARPDAESSGK